MDIEKAAHRQSRAPWQSNSTAKVNPYARAAATNNGGYNNTSFSGGGSLLDVPKQRGADGPNGNGSVSNAGSRRHNRRASIHASAAAAQHRRSFSNAQRPMFEVQEATEKPQAQQKGEYSVNSQVLSDLAGGSASEIDDYFNVLTKQKNLVNRDIKTSINENQKNILELTNDLKETQEELLQLRVSTRELYEILDDFKEAAQRRIEIEEEHSGTLNSRTPSQAARNSRRKLKDKKDRSSIIYLEKMWNDQLQSLFKHVDGASNFVQPIPGRHILAESGRWNEVNVGNWKVVKPAHIFVLNDVILLASKKYPGSTTDTSASTPTSSVAPIAASNSKQKLQAIFCWPLRDLKFSEVTSPNLKSGDENKTYSINLQSNSMSYTFQTDRYDHFLKISEAIKKSQYELQQKDRQADLTRVTEKNQDKKQLRDSLRNSGIEFENLKSQRTSQSQKRNSQDIVLQDISAKVHSRNRSNDFTNSRDFGGPSQGSSQFFSELKRLEDRIDEVDVEISHARYSESVGLLRYIENKLENTEVALIRSKEKNEETESLNEIQILIEVINVKLETRKNQIQNALTFELSKNIELLSGEEIAEIMEFFHVFSDIDKGVSVYLEAMSSHLSNTTSKLVQSVQGSTKIDVVNYLSSMVIIYVSILKRTINTYIVYIVPILTRDDIEDSSDSSGLVSWCTEEVSGLVNTLKKHLYGTLVNVKSSELGEKTYQVKDIKLFNEFLGVVKPQLGELKETGIDLDFLFEDIFLLKYN